MANEVVNRQVNIYIDSGDAQKALDVLTAKEKVLKDQLAKATDPALVKRLTTELNKLAEPIDRATKKVSGQLAPSLRDLEGTVKRLRNEVRNFSGDAKTFDQLTLKLKQANIQFKEAQMRAQGLNTALSNQSGGSSVVGRLGQDLAGLGATYGPLIGVAGAVKLLTDSFEEAIDAEITAARLKNTLDNLGRSDAFDRLQAKASQMAETFKFIDNDEIVGVFEKLITYGKLTEKQITELTPVIINFAAKQRISLEESTDVITKALEGNGKALKTYGIDLKDAGTEGERLNIVMTTLKDKVEGAAEAFGETTQGRIATVRQQFKDLQEDIGTKLLPVVNGFLQGVKFLMIGIEDVANRVSNAFLKIYSPAAYALKKMEEIREANEKDALETAETIAKGFTTITDKQLADRKKSEEKALENAEKILKSRNKMYDEADKEYAAKRVATVKAILTQIQIEEDNRKKKTLGISSPDNADKDKSKKVANQYENDLEEIRKITEKQTVFNKTQLEKDLQANTEYFNTLILKFRKHLQDKALTQKEFDKLFADALDARNRQEALIVDKAAKEAIAAAEKNQKEIGERRLKAALDAQIRIAAELAKRADFELGERGAALELKVITTNGKKKLKAQLDLLNFQEAQEIAAAGNRVNKIALIEEQYRKRRRQAELDSIATGIKEVGEFISGLTSQLSSYFDLQNQLEEANIDRDRAINNKKKENYQKQLANKLITQQEYNKKTNQLDKDLDDKERQLRIKQFNRNKLISIGQATANVAEAVSKMLTAGPVAGQILAGVAAAIGLIQIGIIARQKPPEFERGGVLPGPSHKQGGMPVMDPRSGRKVAEVEGGEPILSRNTYKNNRSLVNALLYSSMHRNGAAIQPSWMNSQPTPMNVGYIRHSLDRMRHFEKGGVLPEPQQAAPVGFSDEQFEFLIKVLREPRKNFVALQDIEDEKIRLENIRSSATIKP